MKKLVQKLFNVISKLYAENIRLKEENEELKKLVTLYRYGDTDGDLPEFIEDIWGNPRHLSELCIYDTVGLYANLAAEEQDPYNQKWLDAMSEKYGWELSQLEDTDLIDEMLDEESFAADILVKNWEALDPQAYELVTGESIDTEGWTDLYKSIPEHRKETLGKAALFDVAYFDAMKRVQARRERLHAAGFTNQEVWADAECIRLEDLYGLYYELEKQAR